MAITQAIPAIDDGIKAFKRLGLAIKSAAAATGTLGKALMVSGIGLAVAAVAALAANWDKVKVALGGVNKEYEDILQKRIDEYINRTITALSKQLELQRKIISIRGGSDVDAATEAVKVYSSAIEEQTKKIDENKKRWEDWNRERGKQARIGNKDVVKQLDAALRGLKAEIEKQEALKKNLELKKQEAEAELEIAKAVEKATKEEEDKKYKKSLAIEMDSAKAILGADKSLQQQLDEKFADKPLKVPVELEIEEDEDNSFDNVLAQKYNNIIEMAKEAAITPESVYDEELRLLNIALDQKKISQEEYYAYLEQLESKKLEGTYAYYTAVANIAQTALSDIGGLFNDLADLQDANTKEGFEQQKKFQIAAATMNMLGGIVSAWTSAMNPSNAWMTIWGQIGMGIASSAMILSSGIMQIQKIKQQAMNGSSASGASASPSTSALATINAPVQYTQDVQGASIEGTIKDTRVVVTEGDISSTQKKVHVAESEATF